MSYYGLPADACSSTRPVQPVRPRPSVISFISSHQASNREVLREADDPRSNERSD
jgi:hypothetical protein